MGTSPTDSPHLGATALTDTAPRRMNAEAAKPVQVASRPAADFLARFREEADAHEMSFEHFMRLALYDPQVGYYTRARRRIGRGARGGGGGQSDFLTATTVGEGHGTSSGTNLFGELVVQSCLSLAGEAFCAKATFVEIGAEPQGGPAATHSNAGGEARAGTDRSPVPRGGVLRGLRELPFAAVKTISVGEDLAQLLKAPSSEAAPEKRAAAPPLIVFSNELFDAQPCRRFVLRDSAWREIWVRSTNEGALAEVEHALENPPDFLPKTAAQGYRIDAPVAARQLLAQIAGADWRGLFIAFDYGKSWRELCEATPQGTARAYTRHRQSGALLDQPGEQDLTCHVCWDWLQAELAQRGFGSIALDSQEAFFVKHASGFIAQTIAADARQLSPRKQALMQLLHPANMGQKFQALSARRGLSPE
ncbi:hypothetical protein AXK11_03065 [Cephaloticoccus primus]|uniref:SAM-dependent methyltransferase n=1 Tax=Cephaloticoccus primus TaxID=1548207 RepID=A0A139SQW6_9BACT|nr:SAM-dependent methyltransferase [Cephaloticoccus primus]KXU37005.1 hypothetical protein AXK11_03065 [Cephaloticoccus primus]